MDIRDSESSGSSDSSEEDISSPEPLIAAFQKVEHLKNVGMSLLHDHSGKLFGKKKPTIRDIIINQQVVLAAIEGYEGKARLSVYTIQKAILMFYTRARLYPSGIVEEHPAVQDWSLKYAIALSRLVSRLRRLMKRSPTSKYKKLTDIKAGARLRGWNFVPGSKSEGRGVKGKTGRGDADGLLQLSSSCSTSTGPGSEISSVVSSSGSSSGGKLGRIVEQLEKIKMGVGVGEKMGSCQSKGQKDAVGVKVPQGGMDGHGVRQDPDGSVPNQPEVPVLPPPKADPEKVNAVLQRLKGMSMPKPDETKMDKPKNPHTIPPFVLANLAGATTQVEPFPIHAQYVKSICHKRAEADDKDSDDDGDDVGAKPGAKAESAQRVGSGAGPEGPDAGGLKAKKNKSDWDYKNIRDAFIKQKKNEGYTYAKAKDLWDQSNEKASYLGAASVQELKKRRFLSKGATINPWAKKPEGGH